MTRYLPRGELYKNLGMRHIESHRQKMFKYFKLMLNTFMASPFVVLAYLKKPHLSALKETGIRVVSITDDRQPEGSKRDEVYNALLLLERYDSETFNRIIKHIRIIFLFPVSHNVGYIHTGWIYSLSLQGIVATFPTKTLPVKIAGNLVCQAIISESKSGATYFDKLKCSAIKEHCRKEQHRIVQKLAQIIGD